MYDVEEHLEDDERIVVLSIFVLIIARLVENNVIVLVGIVELVIIINTVHLLTVVELLDEACDETLGHEAVVTIWVFHVKGRVKDLLHVLPFGHSLEERLLLQQIFQDE